MVAAISGGCGSAGSAAAHALKHRAVSELILVDTDIDLAGTHLMDLGKLRGEGRAFLVRMDEPEGAAEAVVVVSAAAVPHRDGRSRHHCLGEHADLAKELVGQLAGCSWARFLVVVTKRVAGICTGCIGASGGPQPWWITTW